MGNRENDHLEDPGGDGKIILKLSSIKNKGKGRGLDGYGTG
jgi:hypothetical protein